MPSNADHSHDRQAPADTSALTPSDARALVDHAPLGMAVLGRDGQVVDSNLRWRQENWAERWLDQPDKDREATHLVRRSFVNALRGKASPQRVTMVQQCSGQPTFARWVMQPWQNEDGAIVGAMLFVEDVTAQIEADMLAVRRTAALDAVLDNVTEAIIACDVDGRQTFSNRRVQELFDCGFTDAERSIPDISAIQFLEPDRLTACDEEDLPLRRVLRGERVDRRELMFRHNDGRLVALQASAKCIVDAEGKPAGAVVSLHDISDERTRERKLRRSEAEARRIAYTDALTGYPNRASLQRTLQQNMAHLCQEGEKLLVMVADIARFKTINAIHGHDVGDKLLAESADRMAGVAGTRAIVGRLSGDEFLLLIPVPADTPHAPVEQLCTIMNGQQTIAGRMLTVELIAGTATWPDDGGEGPDLLRRADMARRQAKTKMGSGVCHFEMAMEEDARRQLQIEKDLAKAIRTDALTIAYQPIVNAKTSDIEGFEALCRWIHPELGFISPDVFITVAEQTGDILDLGEWMLRNVMNDLKEQDGLSVAVNVSPRQFIDPQFAERLKAALVEFDFDPTRLELEVTESLVLEDQDHIMSQIKTLQAIGVRLAMDDFGTGYSSLAYLQTLKFDKLKIDRSFVLRLGEDREALALVQCMIQMGKSLNMTVVAEGIETEAHALMLRHSGCDSFQGYYFAKPLPWAEASSYNRQMPDTAATTQKEEIADAIPQFLTG